MVIRSKKDIENLIDKWGFLPFFVNDIEGFSIEEHVDPKCWFTAVPGPWEWKGEIIRDGYAYGKIFGKKCGFATLEWYRHLANWRRNGYGFESRKDAGLVPYQDQYVYNALVDYGFIQSNGLKSAAGFDKSGGRKGFDTIITRLQMQCYVCVSDFPYRLDKDGNTYGWGITEYSTPEKLFIERFTKGLGRCKPESSRKKIEDHLHKILPRATDAQIARFIGTN